MGGSETIRWVRALTVVVLSMGIMLGAPRIFVFAATGPTTALASPVTSFSGGSPSPSPTASATLSPPAVPTPTPPPSGTPTPTFTPTATATPTSTPTNTPTPVVNPTPFPLRAVIISEIAWAGTAASANDEWMELYNPTNHAIDLTGWHLSAADGSPSTALSGTIPAHGFYLLERTDDSTVADIPANLIYTGALENGGESLTLTDSSGAVIDTANADGGGWPAGNAANHATMERIGLAPDSDAAWGTNTGFVTHGHDAHGNPLRGTAKSANSVNFPTPSPTPAGSPTPSPAATPTATLTPTATPIPSPTPTPFPLRAVIISEIAWAGTAASANDEWMELYNPTAHAIDLTGWHLSAADGSPSIALSGTIPAHGFYLLERTDDSTVADIPANLIYTGALENGGESLTLTDPSGAVIDTANADGGGWPAGNAVDHATMERIGLAPDSDAAWGTNTGFVTHGHDAHGNPLRGTAKSANSVNFPTPTPSPTPRPTPTPTPRPLKGRVLIGEFLPHPRYDWNHDGRADNGDEFIELVNLGPGAVNMYNWRLDDGKGGSKPFEIPETGLLPGHVVVFFASQTHIRLNDSGDTVRLFASDGRLVDSVTYVDASSWNLSWCRPNWGWDAMTYPCWPTPGGAKNLRYDVATGKPLAASPEGSPTPAGTAQPSRERPSPEGQGFPHWQERFPVGLWRLRWVRVR